MHRATTLRQVADSIDDPLRVAALIHIADEIDDDYQYHQTERTGPYMQRVLGDYFTHFGDGIKRIPLDGRYFCAWKPDVHHFMDHHWGNEVEYIRQQYDCENFAFRFKADADAHGFNNVGVIIDWTNTHAYNIAVYPGRSDPEIIEPQSNEVVSQDGSLYDMERGVILL